MLVRELMTNVVGVISPESLIAEAAQKMSSLNVGFLPVYNGQTLVGIVTDRDIVLRAIARKEEAFTTKIYNIMTPRVEWVYEDQSIEDAARIMGTRQIRRLPVLNKSEMLVGIISITDVLRKGELGLASETMGKICNRF